MAKRSVRLSREAIVESALALADAEGLEAVTIRRLAQENGVTPMAMYWHFEDKEALLDGLADHLIASVRLPEPGTGPWDGQLHGILAAFLATIRPHPAVAGLMLRRMLVAEPGLVLAERVLDLLDEAGFPAARAAEIGTFLICSIIALAGADPAARPGSDDMEQVIREKSALLAALPPARYPRVVAAAPALIACRGDDEYYALNLDLLVQGVRGVRR